MQIAVAILLLFFNLNLQNAFAEKSDILHFSTCIYEEIAKTRAQNNIVISPISIVANLALIYAGASGQTADELRFVFGMDEILAEEHAEQDMPFMTNQMWKLLDNASIYALFVNESLQLSEKYRDSAMMQFHAHIEPMPFTDAAAAVLKVNTWIEEHTNKTIEHFLQTNSVVKNTSMLAISAYRVIVNWLHPFNKSLTHRGRFLTQNGEESAVEMMIQRHPFKYAVVPELNAAALALPYIDKMSFMLILLPNQVGGLQAMEQKIQAMGLKRIVEQMKMEMVTVLLPKFKFDFEVDLKSSMQKAGITSMFSDKADFSKMFTTKAGQKISEVKQKVFIEVNEAATGMGQATYIKHSPIGLTSNAQAKIFRADHPFYFAILDNNVMVEIISGHFAK